MSIRKAAGHVEHTLAALPLAMAGLRAGSDTSELRGVLPRLL